MIGKQINNLRRKVEWNFAEHNYLHKIEVLLSNQQKSLLRNTFYTLKKEKFAFRIFSRAELQQTCNIH